MTHANAFHNPAIGGIWVLQQGYTSRTVGGQTVTNVNTYASDLNQALALDWVTGFCFRVPWRWIENSNSMGDYEFADLEAALTIARNHGKKLSIRPIAGAHTPAYVFSQLGARNYPSTKQSVSGQPTPHPCNTDGTPNTIWITRFLAFMQALFDWAGSKGGDVPYVHGSHFSNEYSEFYHGPEVQPGQTGYGSGITNFINAHKLVWEGVYNMSSSAVATEFGMSGQHVEDIQVAAVEYIHSLAGDWSPRILINANGVEGLATGGTDWGASSETQQDGNCGFAVNGNFNPPAARRVSRMGQMRNPGAHDQTYWHNTLQTVRSSKMEGLEIYPGDGSPVGAPGKAFQGASGTALGLEVEAWLAEIQGSTGTNVNAIGAFQLPRLTVSATAQRHAQGTAAFSLPSLSVAATGVKEPDPQTASAAIALPALTVAATGARADGTGSATVTLPRLSVLATGFLEAGIAGEGFADILLPSLSVSAQGALLPEEGEAVADIVMPALSVEAAGAVHQEAQALVSLPALQSAAQGRSDTRVSGPIPIEFTPVTSGVGLIFPDPPPRRPAAIAIGLFQREEGVPVNGTGSQWGALELRGNYVKGFVLNVKWSELQPDFRGQDFQNHDIDNAIEVAVAQGLQMKVRVFHGGDAPQWAKDYGGGEMLLEVPNTIPQQTFTCGEWWIEDYMGALDDFAAQAQERYNQFTAASGGPIVDWVISGSMTHFAEQDIRGTRSDLNRATYDARGYTLTKDLNSQYRSIDRHEGFTCAASRACNPFQVGTTHQNLPTLTINLMQYARDKLGLYAALGNNSDRTPWPTADGEPTVNMQTIYGAITNFGPPSYIQTAATARVGNLYETCLKAVSYGCTMVELPAGYTADGPTGMTPDQFDEINAALIANAATIGY